MTELITNGSFSTVEVSNGWHVPTGWQVKWNSSWFYGSLSLESVGAVYDATNALRLKYTPDPEWYDVTKNYNFAPGIYQGFNIVSGLESSENIIVSFKARLVSGSIPKKISVFFYDGYLDETKDIYDIHYDSYYEDYIRKNDFEITSTSWTEFSFDIDPKYLPLGVYVLGIAAYVYENGVENEVIETDVIIDDVSFALIPKTAEPEPEPDDTGVIKNGLFTEWDNGVPKDWFLITDGVDASWQNYEFNISQTSEHGEESSLLIEAGEEGYAYLMEEDKMIPGVYQILDFSDYEFGVELTLDFSVRLDTINHPFQSYNYGRIVDIYIYEADENYSPIGGVTDYVYHYEYDNTHSSKWYNCSCTAKLKRGIYYVGITPQAQFGDLGPRTLCSYIVVDNFFGEIKAIEGDFEYGVLTDNSTWAWDSTKMESQASYSSYVPDVYVNQYRTNTSDDYWNSVLINYKRDVLLEDIQSSYSGYKCTVLSKANSKALLNFWHTAKQNAVNFKVCVYESKYKLHTDSYELIEPAILEEVVSTSNTSYHNYIKALDVKYDTYYTIIFYPYCEDGSFFSLILDEPTFTTFDVNKSVHAGTFDDPFDVEDGQLVCSSCTAKDSYVPSYFMYYMNAPKKEYFINLKFASNKYYCTSNGAVGLSGDRMLYLDTMVQSPGDVEGLRYFFKDGVMAKSQVFEYQGVTYRADSKGALTKYEVNISKIDTEAIGITLEVAESKDIEFTFNTQEVSATLSAEIYNASVAAITNIESGKSSNKITILAKSVGETTLRVYHKNADGSMAEKTISIVVMDYSAYQDATIYMAYDSNYVRFGNSIQLEYFIEPEIPSLPIVWTSSDENIATVNKYGSVLAGTSDEIDGSLTGSCVITATNPYSGQQVSCTVYVSWSSQRADSIDVIDSLTLAVDETERVIAKALCAGSTEYVAQDLKWTSSNTKIATVDKYGRITGVSRGEATITCTTTRDASPVSASISVKVIGVPIEVQDIELSCYEIEFNLNWDNNEVKIDYETTPSKANDSVVWESDWEEYVKVTQNGTVYLNPSVTFIDITKVAYVTCTSVTNPNIKKSCRVEVTKNSEKEALLTSLNFGSTLYTCIGQTLRIDYDLFTLNNSKKVTVDASVSNTTNQITYGEDEINKYINFIANEVGTFEVLFCALLDGVVIDSKKVTVVVIEENSAPRLTKNLAVLYALQNNTCILRCKIEDDIDDYDNIEYLINLGDGKGYENIHGHYNPNVNSSSDYQYFFLIGYNLIPGEAYSVKIKAVDSLGLSVETNTVSLIVPVCTVNKAGLESAYNDYTRAMSGVSYNLQCIDAVLDGTMEDDKYKQSFFVEYRDYCYVYDNLRDMLDKCIQHINNQIETAQVEMATLSDALSSDGTSVATYSMGDYTNSNYQSITDMDYYQNECIKQLVMRVLELEARLDELTNNNNN